MEADFSALRSGLLCIFIGVGTDTIKKLLVSQVTGSVRWRESILWMAANDVDEIWEVGSGKALSGMIRRIDKDISLKNFSSAEDIKSAVF